MIRFSSVLIPVIIPKPDSTASQLQSDHSTGCSSIQFISLSNSRNGPSYKCVAQIPYKCICFRIHVLTGVQLLIRNIPPKAQLSYLFGQSFSTPARTMLSERDCQPGNTEKSDLPSLSMSPHPSPVNTNPTDERHKL
ncbi:hypothetical protein NPIL_566911 [Nephila pilipes]|uniref:Uncharacterized protein n=1 Tax=Nephila pilipes TaxID=299642 RepID=A0A8X6MBM9_NEPPI|nr:hypothetical protein NPIL_566911 [Nephila pilipes]